MERGGDDMQQRSPAHEFISILVKKDVDKLRPGKMKILTLYL